MNRAFSRNGLLTDLAIPRGKQEATRRLFVGAFGVLRNSANHREIDYSDVSEAGRAMHIASLLMRALDRV